MVKTIDKRPRIKKVLKDLEEALDACSLRKKYGLSEREVAKIVRQAAQRNDVYQAVIRMFDVDIDGPEGDEVTDHYNDVVNGALFEITEQLVD